MWHRGIGADAWTSGKGDDGGKEVRRAPRATDLAGTVRRTNEALETRAKAKA